MPIVRAIAVVAVVVLVAAPGAGGGAERDGKTKTSRWFWTDAGPARRVFTMPQPAGVVLLTRLTTTHGIRASVDARIPGVAGVRVVSGFTDASARCRRRGSLKVCTQDQQWCPMPRAKWRIHILKTGGPAGLIRFDFVVGKPPRS